MSSDESNLVLITRSDRQIVAEDLYFLASRDAQIYFCRAHPSFPLPFAITTCWSCEAIDPDDSALKSEFNDAEWSALHTFNRVFEKICGALPSEVPSIEALFELPTWQEMMREAAATVAMFPDIPAPEVPVFTEKPKIPWVGEKRSRQIGNTTVEFTLEEYWWSSELRLRCWGNTALPVHLYIEDQDSVEKVPFPEASQFQVVELLLTQQEDFQPRFEEQFFPYYQNEIYGTLCNWSKDRGYYGEEELTPPITRPSDLRSMCKEPSIWINFPEAEEMEQNTANQFQLSFECSWDEEHGVSVEITDWKITDFHAESY